MDLLQRLAHARTLERLGRVERERQGNGVVAAPEPPRVEKRESTSAFERCDVEISLSVEPAGSREFGVRASGRPALLGNCLDRLGLPTRSRLAEDLVCLGAGQGTRAVALDIEATGMGGVAVPFMIGLAWYEPSPERLLVAQWTLARLDGEAELLADVFAALRDRIPEPIITFNGASFDLPLLRIRARRHGLSARVLDAETVDHLDLLPPARRLQKGRGRDCRLATLERDLLGLHRCGDIDSAEIPAVFWRWINHRSDPAGRRRLQAVAEHNLVDVVSLPALASRLAQLVREPGDLDRARRCARHLCARGAEHEARMMLARWVEPGLAPGAKRDALWRTAALELATLERRAGQRSRAAVLWRAVWEADPGCPIAAEAWAKQLEHGDRDLREALRVARGSRLRCERRIGRLERRLGVTAGETVEPVETVEPAEPMRAVEAVEPVAPAKPTRTAARDASLLSVVEDHGGAKLRYRLLR